MKERTQLFKTEQLSQPPRLWLTILLLLAIASVVAIGARIAFNSPEYVNGPVISLQPSELPWYAAFSLFRMAAAYLLSILFTLAYGYAAASTRRNEQIMIPLLDVLQSVPILSFLPLVLLSLTAFIPVNLATEIAAIILIFTSQAWNMTFSFYHSVSSVPADLREAGTVYRFSVWERFRWIELPYATMGLVWNSMMSMAGGWFFLMVCEAFQLGSADFRLPGIGSYMSVAVERGRIDAMLWAIAAMVAMIVGLDQLLWRPIVVWAQKYRIEEGSHEDICSS